MIDPAARGAWRELEAKLRPFIARRVNFPPEHGLRRSTTLAAV